MKTFCFGQISESGLIEILEKVSQQTEKKTTVTVRSTKIPHTSVCNSSLNACCTASHTVNVVFSVLAVQQTESDGLR